MNILECCFCGSTIHHKKYFSLVVQQFEELNINSDDDEIQQLFCHIDCLKNSLAPNIPILD